jgi:hypothetical protein
MVSTDEKWAENEHESDLDRRIALTDTAANGANW